MLFERGDIGLDDRSRPFGEKDRPAFHDFGKDDQRENEIPDGGDGREEAAYGEQVEANPLENARSHKTDKILRNKDTRRPRA